MTFVSITQSFNTTTSMGRLTLNILLSFAQFEREVTGERIRDKIAASRRKGIWMGGFVPTGYNVKDRKLIINAAEAAVVRGLFERFVELGSVVELVRDATAKGLTNKRGRPIDKGQIYKLFRNRVYRGEAVHKGTSYPGEHKAIIDEVLWDKVHAILAISPRTRAKNSRRTTPALLKGLVFGPDGRAMSPGQTRKKGKLYRYYVSQTVIQHGAGASPIARVPAGEIETAVIEQVRHMLRAPEVIVAAWAQARQHDGELTEQEMREALVQLDPLWEELFPAEQARVIQLLVDRVDIMMDEVAIRLRNDGLSGLAGELASISTAERIAA